MTAKVDSRSSAGHEFVPQAILGRPPAFFAAFGVVFQPGLDDINEFEVAELRLEGVPVALMRHEGTPADETEVYLPNTIPSARVGSIIRLIMREYDLPPTALRWQREPGWRLV
jgi:hypothetical protein